MSSIHRLTPDFAGELTVEAQNRALEREMRILRDELSQAIDLHQQLRDAANAAREEAIAAAERQLPTEIRLSEALAELANTRHRLAQAEAALNFHEGTVAGAATRMFRGFKERHLPAASLRRAAYDWALNSAKSGLRGLESRWRS